MLRAYLCTRLTPVGRNGGDDNEIIEVIDVPLQDVQDYLMTMQKAGTLIDLKVFGLIELAKARLGKS
jgi:hypothetical protein